MERNSVIVKKAIFYLGLCHAGPCPTVHRLLLSGHGHAPEDDMNVCCLILVDMALVVKKTNMIVIFIHEILRSILSTLKDTSKHLFTTGSACPSFT